MKKTNNIYIKCIFCKKENKVKHISINTLFASIDCCKAYQQFRRQSFDNNFRVYNYQIVLKHGNIASSKNKITITYKINNTTQALDYNLSENFPYVNQHNAQKLFYRYIKSMILK